MFNKRTPNDVVCVLIFRINVRGISDVYIIRPSFSEQFVQLIATLFFFSPGHESYDPNCVFSLEDPWPVTKLLQKVFNTLLLSIFLGGKDMDNIHFFFQVELCSFLAAQVENS